MKYRKMALLFGAVFLTGTLLVACGNNEDNDGEDEPVTEDVVDDAEDEE